MSLRVVISGKGSSPNAEQSISIAFSFLRLKRAP
jgi:hypothetical protein